MQPPYPFYGAYPQLIGQVEDENRVDVAIGWLENVKFFEIGAEQKPELKKQLMEIQPLNEWVQKRVERCTAEELRLA